MVCIYYRYTYYIIKRSRTWGLYEIINLVQEKAIDMLKAVSNHILSLERHMKSKITHQSYKLFSSVIVQKFGGHDEVVFRQLCCKGSRYMVDILKPQIRKLEHGKMSLHLPYREMFSGFNYESFEPLIHNGITISLLDHTAGFCGWSSIDDSNYFVSTIGEFVINFNLLLNMHDMLKFYIYILFDFVYRH